MSETDVKEDLDRGEPADFITAEDLVPGMLLISAEYTLFPAKWGFVVLDVDDKGFWGRDTGHNNLWFFSADELHYFHFYLDDGAPAWAVEEFGHMPFSINLSLFQDSREKQRDMRRDLVEACNHIQFLYGTFGIDIRELQDADYDKHNEAREFLKRVRGDIPDPT